MKDLVSLTWDDEEALLQDFAQHLREGGALLRDDCARTIGEPVTLSLRHPTGQRTIQVEAVVVALTPIGTGLALTNFDSKEKARLERFVHCPKPEKTPAANPHERVRRLSAPERHRLARRGDATERNALERAFSKDVWEPLLANPKITIPEVARIARMGSLPLPLLELIVSRPAWLSAGLIRRALLSNPRLGGPSLEKVLRASPRNELKLMAQQSAYPMPVRELARRIMKR